ncbi:MAG: CBS domain-containing protein [Trueperaceae bacterium]|nr:CBS domain-containing protein [Trueperaceae bacterium]
MLVSEWMTKDPRVVSSKTPIMEAMQMMRSGGYRRLPVVDGGALVGIVTDRDLRDATPSQATSLSVYELNYLLSKLSLKEVMQSAPITVSPDDPVERAALLMEEHKISGLPVVEHERVVGIFTITDMLRAFVTGLGLREGGTRVTAELPDEPGVLARVANAGPPSNIVAVMTSGRTKGERRKLVLRVVGDDAEGYPERLRADGIDVSDVR